MKEIKLSVDSVKKQNEENKDDELIDDEKKDNNENISKEENKKNKNEDNNKSFKMEIVGSGKQNKKNINILEIASVDEAKFNRLKKNIVDNNETFVIFYMKLLNLIFSLLTIFFIIYDSIINKNNIVNLDKFLNENLIFNHSKISAGILYLESNLLKYLRDGYLNDSACLTNTCQNIYLSQIIFAINDMKDVQDKFSTLSSDFLHKINIIEELTVKNKNSSEIIEVNMEFMMNLLINFSLRLKEASIKLKENNNKTNDTSTDDYSNKVDIALINLIEQSDKLETLNIDGFSGQNKTDKINNLFNPFPISLVIMVISIIIFIGGFFYFIYYLYTYEVFFIEKLIDFNNPKYEAYLKQLEELKKKLRNENEDDDDEDKEDDLGFGTGMGTKKEEEPQKNKMKDKNEEDKKDKEDQKMQKRIRGKEKSKLQHQQKKKKKIMKNFFLKINIFFCIKIFVLAFLALTYYIFSTVIKSDTRTDYLEVESITDQTEGIYKKSLDIHLNLLRKIKTIVDYVNEKEEAQKTGNSNKVNFPNITIPSIDQLEYPKLGNLLMPIISSSGDESSISSQFNQLYNGDACQFLFQDNENEYRICLNFWNGIIAKGMEQSLTQMSVSITSVLDDLKNLNKETVNRENMTDFLDDKSYFYQFKVFMEYYFYLSYLKTAEMFNVLKKRKIENIKVKFDILLILYLIVSILLLVLVLLFIYSIKSYFNSFLNFVAIFPLRFISEDENLFRNILKLDESLFS